MKNEEKYSVSIIIPAKNEESFLLHTLKTLKSQEGIKTEIIVAISPNTSDATEKIAKKNKCKIVKGGLPGKARNNGAKIASNGILFFLDADTFPEDRYFLKKSLKEFYDRNLDMAGTLLFPDYKIKNIRKIFYNILYSFINKEFLRREDGINPKQQSGMFIKKDVFDNIGRFNNSIFGEDSELAEKGVKKGFNFGILKTPGKLINSVRRYEKQGLIRTVLKAGYLNAKAELFGYDSLKKSINSYFGENSN